MGAKYSIVQDLTATEEEYERRKQTYRHDYQDYRRRNNIFPTSQKQHIARDLSTPTDEAPPYHTLFMHPPDDALSESTMTTCDHTDAPSLIDEDGSEFDMQTPPISSSPNSDMYERRKMVVYENLPIDKNSDDEILVPSPICDGDDVRQAEIKDIDDGKSESSTSSYDGGVQPKLHRLYPRLSVSSVETDKTIEAEQKKIPHIYPELPKEEDIPSAKESSNCQVFPVADDIPRSEQQPPMLEQPLPLEEPTRMDCPYYQTQPQFYPAPNNPPPSDFTYMQQANPPYPVYDPPILVMHSQPLPQNEKDEQPSVISEDHTYETDRPQTNAVVSNENFPAHNSQDFPSFQPDTPENDSLKAVEPFPVEPPPMPLVEEPLKPEIPQNVEVNETLPVESSPMQLVEEPLKPEIPQNEEINKTLPVESAAIPLIEEPLKPEIPQNEEINETLPVESPPMPLVEEPLKPEIPQNVEINETLPVESPPMPLVEEPLKPEISQNEEINETLPVESPIKPLVEEPLKPEISQNEEINETLPVESPTESLVEEPKETRNLIIEEPKSMEHLPVESPLRPLVKEPSKPEIPQNVERNEELPTASPLKPLVEEPPKTENPKIEEAKSVENLPVESPLKPMVEEPLKPEISQNDEINDPLPVRSPAKPLAQELEQFPVASTAEPLVEQPLKPETLRNDKTSQPRKAVVGILSCDDVFES